MTVRVLIVDDEPVARRRLSRMLGEIPGVEVAGEAANGEEALEGISTLRPDLVLLDIRMPGLDGLALARSSASLPPIVFTTAYDAHAVEAWETCAVDYLLKPIKRDRLERALARARLARGGALQEAALTGENARRRAAEAAVRIVARDGDTTSVFDATTISRFYAADKYSVFVSGGREHLLEESLSTLEDRLVPHGFIRVHRGELVALACVHALHAERNGGWLELRDGQRVRVSRRHLPALRRAIRLD
jgi:DNA-binding LytR/AlgR family response regulator